jgi:hypothetical protein
VALQPAKARMDVGRQHGAGEIAQMLDAVDIGQGTGDEVTGHGRRALGASLVQRQLLCPLRLGEGYSEVVENDGG